MPRRKERDEVPRRKEKGEESQRGDREHEKQQFLRNCSSHTPWAPEPCHTAPPPTLVTKRAPAPLGSPAGSPPPSETEVEREEERHSGNQEHEKPQSHRNRSSHTPWAPEPCHTAPPPTLVTRRAPAPLGFPAGSPPPTETGSEPRRAQHAAQRAAKPVVEQQEQWAQHCYRHHEVAPKPPQPKHQRRSISLAHEGRPRAPRPAALGRICLRGPRAPSPSTSIRGGGRTRAPCCRSALRPLRRQRCRLCRVLVGRV